jgi:signal peptidase I
MEDITLKKKEELTFKDKLHINYYDLVSVLATALVTIMIIFTFIFRVVGVVGSSMVPTLHDGDWLIVSAYDSEPEYGQVVIVTQPNYFNEPIVKRVIGIEGQKVYIDFTEGYIEVDGVRLEEDYIQLVNSLGIPTGEYEVFAEHHFRMEPQSDGQTHRIFEAIVPKGELFVMGDNRNNSSDSRTNVIGFVDERRVLGKVLYRMSPDHGLTPID